jgi:hypothetical protein
MPELHCALLVHAAPAADKPLQLPFASQNALPEHVSGSGPFFTGVHAPVPAAHEVHGPLHVADAQHTPSLHTPVEHCALTVHAVPGVRSATHTLDALQ